MTDDYMYMTLAPLALGWILSLCLLRTEKPRLLALVICGTLVIALVLIVLGHAAMIERIEGARGQSYFNEAWLARGKARAMKPVVVMLVLGIPPAIMAAVGLFRTSGPLLNRIEPPWLANGTRRTRRTFYSLVMSVVVCLIAGAVFAATEFMNG